jgi:hypothetical protein
MSAALLALDQQPEDLEALLALEPIVRVGAVKSFLPGLTVKSRPSSQRLSPGGSCSKGYICDMS